MPLEILPLNLGVVTQVENSGQQYLTGAGRKIEAQMIVWLIVGGADLIVVDSGPGTPELVKALHSRELRQHQDQTVPSALAAHNLSPADVDVVLQTHLHWDHCLGLEANSFPNAEILVQRKEIQYAAAPYLPHVLVFDPTVAGGLLAAPAGRYERVKVMDGDFTLIPGVDVLHTPGHTPGLQIPIVHCKNSTYAIASDNVPLSSNMNGDDPMRWTPPGIHINLEDWYGSIRRLARLADVVLPSHDSSVLIQERYT